MPSRSTAPDAAFQAQVRARYAGNPQAITALAARITVGRDAPCSPLDAEALFNEAAHQGDTQAWWYLALLAAAGVGRAQSWRDAFEALNRAAQLAHEPARRDLQLLAALGITTADQAIAWIRAYDTRLLRETPRFAVHTAFLPPPLCRALIAHAGPRLQRAQVVDAHSGTLKTDPMRTNRTAAYSLIDTTFAMQLTRARIAAAASVAQDALEPMEVLHYAGGETYRPHVDFFHPALPNYANEMRLRGQRIRTCLVYLNTDYEGGETEFPKLGIKFRGDEGEALVFDNVGADGAGDLNTLHTGLPVTHGEKWLLSQWIRNQPQPIA